MYLVERVHRVKEVERRGKEVDERDAGEVETAPSVVGFGPKMSGRRMNERRRSSLSIAARTAASRRLMRVVNHQRASGGPWPAVCRYRP